MRASRGGEQGGIRVGSFLCNGAPEFLIKTLGSLESESKVTSALGISLSVLGQLPGYCFAVIRWEAIALSDWCCGAGGANHFPNPAFWAALTCSCCSADWCF